jgi:hypothetical protein
MRTNTSEKFISNVENGKDTAQLGKVLLLVRVLDMGTRLIDLSAKEGKNYGASPMNEILVNTVRKGLERLGSIIDSGGAP